ncbi:hypothetical protein ABZP36_031323 [Zizania latifolia]
MLFYLFIHDVENKKAIKINLRVKTFDKEIFRENRCKEEYLLLLLNSEQISYFFLGQVKAEKKVFLFTKIDEGLLHVIKIYGVTKLVMGVASDKHYSTFLSSLSVDSNNYGTCSCISPY